MIAEHFEGGGRRAHGHPDARRPRTSPGRSRYGVVHPPSTEGPLVVEDFSLSRVE